MPKLETVTENFKRGQMSVYEIQWLIQELQESRERITDLEGTAEQWMKQSISDSNKLLEANKRIKELEKEHSKIG